MDAGDVEEHLQTLDQTYGFVTYLKEEELPDHTLTLKYRFVHVLYQNALFGTLTPSRRASLSAAIAAALLAFYGSDSSDVASELAFLFQRRATGRRRRSFSLKAARNAARIFANQEAVSLCQRGLEMATGRRTLRAHAAGAKLQMTLGPSLMTVKGFAATETLRTFARPRPVRAGGGRRAAVPGACLDCRSSPCVARVREGAPVAEQCLQPAERADEAALLVTGALGSSALSLQFIGDLPGSREHSSEASRSTIRSAMPRTPSCTARF